VFGPELVCLGPEEQFTVSILSGATPKKPGVIQTLYTLLGPDFSTDEIIVETTDHARLRMRLSYNWRFNVSKDTENPSKIFSVKDFVGDMCNAIAARIRAAVAQEKFETFHKKSARLIRGSLFGVNDQNKINDSYDFKDNGLCVFNVDIQSVEPDDLTTKASLYQTVKLAIEITTKSQEANAKHTADTAEQEARGNLNKQKLADASEEEELRKILLEYKAESDAVEKQGKTLAESMAKSEANEITAESEVKLAGLRSTAFKLQRETELKIDDMNSSATID